MCWLGEIVDVVLAQQEDGECCCFFSSSLLFNFRFFLLDPITAICCCWYFGCVETDDDVPNSEVAPPTTAQPPPLLPRLASRHSTSAVVGEDSEAGWRQLFLELLNWIPLYFRNSICWLWLWGIYIYGTIYWYKNMFKISKGGIVRCFSIL